MGYKLSKNITGLFRVTPFGYLDKSPAEGLLVRLKGDTFIKCGKGQKPYGVYTAGSYRRMRLLTGEKIELLFQRGLLLLVMHGFRAHRKRIRS